MSRLMSINDAVQLTGLTRKAIGSAIWRGQLKATKESHWTPAGERERYLIDPKDLREYIQKRPANDRVRWTADLDAALTELLQSCNVAQAASYLGITTYSASHRVKALRAKGFKIPNLSRSTLAYVIPKTAILLARTCLACGELRDSSQYRQRRGGQAGRETICRACESKDLMKRGAGQKLAKALQDISLASAHNKRSEWTLADDEVLSDTSKTDFEIALELGRTYFSVRTRRLNIGIKKRERQLDHLAVWAINFPKSHEAVVDRFKALGTPIAAEFWEWTDSDVQVSA